MMKRVMGPLLVLVVGVGLLLGCAKKNEVNTSGLEKSFRDSEPAAQGLVDQTVTAVKNSDWGGAMSNLQKLAKQAELTPEQQAAIKDLIAQVQKAMSASAAEMQSGATKAAEDMKKSLPGQ